MMLQHAMVSVRLLVMLAVIAQGQPGVEEIIRKARDGAPEIFMKAPETAARHGYSMETHHIVSPDGYILTAHRIPGSKPPVYLQHGLSTTSDSWIGFGHNRSLAYQLADNGYDVWLGNARGNSYSRNHTTMDPSQRAFWEFSWHEMGVLDLPTTIDYILNITGHKKLIYVGHSMGCTISYAMLSARPEYNSKVRLVISLSPAVYLRHYTSRLAIAMSKNKAVIKKYLETRPTGEFFHMTDAMVAAGYYLYHSGSGVRKSLENILIELCGDSEGFSKSDILTMSAMGSGTSVRTLLHFLQVINSGKFRQYDFGAEENQKRYNSTEPPAYELERITTPVAIQYGETDGLISTKDVQEVVDVLPNVVEVRKVPTKYFNHLDFLTHKRLKELLNDHLIEIIKKYQ